MITLRLDTREIAHLGDALRRADGNLPGKIVARALKHSGDKARTAVRKALVAQTGLRYGVMTRAIKGRMEGGAYVIRVKGGDVRLKYFKPRETRRGVTAAPWNKRRLYPSSFMKAGWWPKRVVKSNWNGHVFKRTGGKTKTGMDQFEVQRSGLFIPQEMVAGASRSAFFRVAESELMPRLLHELARALPGG